MLTRTQRILLVIPLALLLIPFLIGPALWGFLASFTNFAPFQRTVQFVGLRNYQDVLGDSTFQAAARNIVLFTVITVVGEFVLGLAVAYALREPFRGRGILRFILLLPWLVSPVASGVMWHFLVNADKGVLNFWPALLGLPHLPYPITLELAMPTTIAIEIWRKTPLVCFLVLPGLLAIPVEQWDQAKIEGIPPLVQVRHIVLPRLRVLLLTIALLLIGDAFGTFESIQMLTGGGPGTATLIPGLYSYSKAFVAFNWVGGATSAWLIAVGVLLVGLCYLWLVRQNTNLDMI